MTEHEAADWLERTLPGPERLSGRDTAVWLGVRAREIGLSGMCVEVGTWCGYTALALAFGGPIVACVDTFLASDSQTGKHALDRLGDNVLTTLPRFLRRIAEAPEPVKVVPLIGRSPDVARAFGPMSLDLVFIDGDHDFEAVVADLVAWSTALKPGGLCCGHNMGQAGVADAVTRFLAASGWPVAQDGPDQLWWSRKPS